MKKNILLIATTIFVSVIALNSCTKEIEECQEFFEKDCPVTTDYEPVCGCNNKTYSNKTVAECAGIAYTNGACN